MAALRSLRNGAQLGRRLLSSQTGKQGSEEEVEKLGFFRATGGLLAASIGAIAVFSVGVVGVLGTAKAAASLLGHSLDPKPQAAEKTELPPPVKTADALRVELEELRAMQKAKEEELRKLPKR